MGSDYNNVRSNDIARDEYSQEEDEFDKIVSNEDSKLIHKSETIEDSEQIDESSIGTHCFKFLKIVKIVILPSKLNILHLNPFSYTSI